LHWRHFAPMPQHSSAVPAPAPAAHASYHPPRRTRASVALFPRSSIAYQRQTRNDEKVASWPIRSNKEPTQYHLLAQRSSEMTTPAGSKDMDREKGAVEGDDQRDETNTSMSGQLNHRDQASDIKPLDT